MRLFIAVFLALALAGCATNQTRSNQTTYNQAAAPTEVSFNATATPNAAAYKTYFFLPPDGQENKRDFPQYAAQVDQVLAQNGFVKTQDSKQANLIVGLVTAVENERHTETGSYYPMGFMLTAWAQPARGTRDIQKVWRVSATAKSQNNDFSSIFPNMLQATSPYIAKDSGGTIRINVPGK